MLYEQKIIDDLGDRLIKTPNLLSIYVKKYEINELLEFLLSLYKLNVVGKVDFELNEFRMNQKKKNPIHKGFAINYLKKNTNNLLYPYLKEKIKIGYNISLRNIIGHNDYFIDVVDNSIQSISTKEKFQYSKLVNALYQLQELQNCIFWYLAICSFNRDIESLKDKGIIDIAFVYKRDNCLELHINQLNSFFLLSENKEWLKVINILITGKKLKTQISETEIEGEYFEKLYEWILKVQERGNVKVIINSITPYANQVGIEDKLIINGDFFHIEKRFIKVLPLHIINIAPLSSIVI